METFTELKALVDNPHYQEQRKQGLETLDINSIDTPIVEIVRGFAKLSYCYTLQSCYGHFLYSGQKDQFNIEPLPITDNITSVEYRIAYIALCIENSVSGRTLLHDLSEITAIDPEYIQFGCAEWFWGRVVNSYALQVEPRRQMTQDKARVDYQEAQHIEKIRSLFFAQLKNLLQGRLQRNVPNH